MVCYANGLGSSLQVFLNALYRTKLAALLHLFFSFRPDLERILELELLMRKLFSLPSGKFWTLKMQKKCMFGLDRKFV